jgi:adenine/guanine phosphoribosyltransferase-like PRPP-binding protein
VGFVGIRKAGKLPLVCDRLEFTDYTNTRKGLELAPGTFIKDDLVLLVDEWIETGAQVRTAAQLIENQGAIVSAITGIAMERNRKTQDLFERYRCLPLTDGRIMGI